LCFQFQLAALHTGDPLIPSSTPHGLVEYLIGQLSARPPHGFDLAPAVAKKTVMKVGRFGLTLSNPR
jgi:hypothetical protein